MTKFMFTKILNFIQPVIFRVEEYERIMAGLKSANENPDVPLEKSISLAYMMSLCGKSPHPPSFIDRLVYLMTKEQNK